MICPVTYVVEMPDKLKTMTTVHVETIKPWIPTVLSYT